LKAAENSGAKGLASHDEVFRKVEELEVIDPVPKIM